LISEQKQTKELSSLISEQKQTKQNSLISEQKTDMSRLMYVSSKQGTLYHRTSGLELFGSLLLL